MWEFPLLQNLVLGKRDQTFVYMQAARGVICESNAEIPVWALLRENSHQVNSVISCLTISKDPLSMLLQTIGEARFVVGDNTLTVLGLCYSWNTLQSAQPCHCRRTALLLPAASSAHGQGVTGARHCPPPATHPSTPQLNRGLSVGGIHMKFLLSLTFKLHIGTTSTIS